VRTHEGMTPIGEAHGRPPDLPDPQTQGSTAWEPSFVVPKARVRVHKVRRPVPDKGARTHPDPWPSPGIIIADPDTCIGSASQLEGEQNFHVPCVGSELHAAPSAPQHFSFSPSPPIPSPLPDTLTRDDPSRGEGTATEWHTIEDRCPELWKPPDLHIEVLEEAGGALLTLGNSPVLPENIGPFGLAGATKKADAGGVEPLGIDADERGGVPSLMGAAPALAEGTAGVGPAGEAETATTAEPEALAPRAQDKVGRRREVDVPPHDALPQMGKRNPQALSGKRKPERPEVPPQRGRRKSEALPPGGERKCGNTPQSNEGDHKPSWPSRELSHEAIPSTWEGAAPWDPGGRPPRG